MEFSASFWFSVCYWGISAVILRFYWSFIRNQDALNPIYFNTVVFFLYALGGGMASERGMVVSELGLIDPQIVPKFYVLCILGAACFQIGFVYWAYHHRTSRCDVGTSLAENRNYREWLYAAAILSAVFFGRNLVVHIVPLIGDRYLDTVLPMLQAVMDDSAAGFKWYLTNRFPLTIVLAAATVAMFKSRITLVKIFSGAIILGTLISGIIIGFRQALMFNALIPAIYYHYRVRRFSMWQVFLGAICVYFLITALAFVRYIELDSMVETYIGMVQDRPEILSPMSGETTGPTGFFMNMLADIDAGHWDYQYTRPILDSIYILVPRVLLDRPTSAYDEYLSHRSPRVAAMGGGFGTFVIQEPYLSFGTLGVVVFMFIAGMVISALYIFFTRECLASDSAALIYSIIFYVVCIQSVRSSMFCFPKYILMGIGPLLVIAIVSSLSRKMLKGNRLRMAHLPKRSKESLLTAGGGR